jgi:DNA-directed RNA polymerase specialized sigma24 family protein
MDGTANLSTANATFWEHAYMENFPTLCARASRQLTKGNVVEAEETVSEAFARVMRYAVRPEIIENPLSYLWTVVKRVWTTQKVSEDKAMMDSLDYMSADAIDSIAAVRVEPEVLKMLDQDENRRQLKLKLGPLSLEEKQLVDFYLKGYSWNEVADELGEDVKQIQFRWYRFTARQRYRDTKLRARTQSPATN